MKHDLIIGKYTLESITNGMYASPLDFYREYIQNAVDSIDDAISDALESNEEYEIAINIDPQNRMISIFDNGKGISCTSAISTLIDIGNSSKQRSFNRGFRGIGRLAGLGYCDELVFSTTFQGEETKTIVHFNAKLLKQLLLASTADSISVEDVMNQIVTIETKQEKKNAHYFEVKMIGVTDNDALLDIEQVKDYLVQHSPLPYANDFNWKTTVQEKMRIAGYEIPKYNIRLNHQQLFKPYTDSFISDRSKKMTDSIQDIHVCTFHRDGILSAILWYAQTSYFGTINDNTIKGIRIRQGNILIGDRTTCNTFFKEERFNGWIIGELHILDPELIANSRRDDFEKNDAYYVLVHNITEWANTISKEIRRISYERSLSREKKAVVEAESVEDVNDLCTEAFEYEDDSTESDYLDSSESAQVAEGDYMDKLSFLLDQKRTQTKYRALNINTKLTMEQRKVLERVFDLIKQEYDDAETERFIEIILRNF